MASELAVDQAVAIRQFIDLCNQIGSTCAVRRNISQNTAIKFLYARKFDIPRAVSLYEQHEQIRIRECLYNIDPNMEPLRTELETGKFTILSARDSSGAAIALFTASKHSPLCVTHTTTLQGIVYQLDCALQDTETQKAGLVFIYDMSGSKYSNFDYDLSQKILTLLKGGYPARLKKVLIVTAPLWFKAPFKILRLFVREKLRERVFTVSVPTLSLHVPRKALPRHLGGNLDIDHSLWLQHCHKSMTNREDELLANIGPAKVVEAISCHDCNCKINNLVNNHITATTGTTTTTVAGTTTESTDSTTVASNGIVALTNDTGVVADKIGTRPAKAHCDCLSKRLAEAANTTVNSTTIKSIAAATATTITATAKELNENIPATLNGIHVNGTILAPLIVSNNHLQQQQQQQQALTTTSELLEQEYIANNTKQQQQQQQQQTTTPAGEFWSENPPSSASSGFSDDDSLAGQEGDPKTIEQIVQMVRERGRQGLIKEYGEIRNREPEGTFLHARMRSNSTKNRYTDVLCYDHSRVVLSRENDDECSDYINANFVDGYKQKNAYISTQGPLPKTSQDFWRMIWEQHCLVIVMTTRVMERGRIKCGQYWQPTENSCLQFGHFNVRTISIDSKEDYTITSLELKNSKTDEIRRVSHWQFTSWPDYGVPSSAMAMLNFLQKVREKQAEMVRNLGDTWAGHPRGPPIVVHCSAGIGRTGTFITLDICISRLEDVGTADIRGTVEKIRSQRAYSIQMPDQYVFCHLALIEYAISRGMQPSVDLAGFDDREHDSD